MEPRRDLPELLADTMDRYDMALPGGPLLVAVSGGLDSMCLLHLLCRWAKDREHTLRAATVDHGLRPFHRERECVANLCASLAVEHTALALEPGLRARAAQAGKSLAHAARDERYAALRTAAIEAGATRIALGHHADDQAETVILRLLRGTGLTGIAAMRPVSAGVYVRPLLGVRRRELEAYAAEHKVCFVEDPSNRTPDFLRNRIRQEVVPVLESLSPEAVEVITRSVAVMGDELDAMAEIVDGLLDEAVAVDDRGIVVPVDRLSTGPVRRLLLHRLLARTGEYPPESRHVQQVERLLGGEAGSRQVDLPGDVVVRREYSNLRVTSPSAAAPDYELELTGAGEYGFPLGTVRVGRVEKVAAIPPDSSSSAYFMAHEVVFPLHLRPYRKGDRLWPFKGSGTTLVSDLFIDQKVPGARRSFVPILTDREGALLWVVGVRRSNHWPVSPGEPAYEIAVELDRRE